ncbi:MAG: electron transport complex subunit RsxE [Defluviitaleaceae bacterium]|nr:electron transport complex subunit RsxE [Defluviitaleaceae bacterium]
MSSNVKAEALAPEAVSKQKYNYKEIISVGMFKENPVFTLLLSLCSALGVTSSTFNSIAFGFMVLVCLIITNTAISLIGKYTPSEIRIPVYITVIAAVVTIIEMLIQAFFPDLFAALGLFIALIVVNCIILGRAESFAGKNPVLPSIADAIGSGTGILIALSTIAVVRELIGTGGINLQFFSLRLFPQQFGIGFFVQPMGSFIVLGMIVGIITSTRLAKARIEKTKPKAPVAAKA